MRTHYTPLQQANLQSFYEFARMNNLQKANVLKSNGVLLDKDREKEQSVSLYYLYGFFVEETCDKNQVVEIIPYKHGYRLETYAEIKPVLVPKQINVSRKY